MDRVRKLIGLDRIDTQTYNGDGITVAILDTGITNHPDFEQRIIAFEDFVGHRKSMYDDNGHGTHIAGIIGGSGGVSNGRFCGVAPKVQFVIGKVLNSKGDGTTRHIIDGIEWCVLHKEEYDIKVLNISAGMLNETKEKEQAELVKAVLLAWNRGITVITAAGNNGPDKYSVTVPGTTREVITVGCMDDKNLSKRNGGLQDGYSGVGPTKQCIVKPEVVAPGTNIRSCSYRGGYMVKTGTSMAVPVVVGVVALMYQRFPKITPVGVKLKFYERCIPNPANQRFGWGQIYVPSLLF